MRETAEVNIIASFRKLLNCVLLRLVKAVNGDLLSVASPLNSRSKVFELHRLGLGEILVPVGHIQTIKPCFLSRTCPVKE